MNPTRAEVQSWPIPQSRQEAESALAAGRLYVDMSNGRFWAVRRNGKTQTWKTRDDFRIPVKAGLKAYGEFNQHSVGSSAWRIKPEG